MKPRIVLVVPIFPKVSETFVVHDFTRLLEKGWDVHVVCTTRNKPDLDSFPIFSSSPELRRRVHLSWPHIPRWMEFLLFPFVFFNCLFKNPLAVFRYLSDGYRQFGFRTLNHLYLDAQFIALKPSVIHFEFADLAKSRTHMKGLLNCKIVASFRGHELNFVGLENEEFFEEVWKESDAVVFVSKDLLNRAHKRGFRNNNHSIILGSVDCKYFDPAVRDIPADAGSANRPIRILSIGRLSWSKGYEYGLKAIHRLVRNGIRCEYRIAGDGPYREAIHFAIQDFDLKESVRLLSWCPPSEVKEQMQWADIFLHSSVSEGFGMVVLEAQAMELPVVCTDADGLSENVSDGETGFVVPRRDSEALAERLIRLSLDSNLRKKMGEAGRKRAMTCFGVDDEVAAYDRLFSRVLQRSKFPGETIQSEHPATSTGN